MAYLRAGLIYAPKTFSVDALVAVWKKMQSGANRPHLTLMIMRISELTYEEAGMNTPRNLANAGVALSTLNIPHMVLFK
jgi:hypothetical protein